MGPFSMYTKLKAKLENYFAKHARELGLQKEGELNLDINVCKEDNKKEQSIEKANLGRKGRENHYRSQQLES
jgi:hypothetical protein